MLLCLPHERDEKKSHGIIFSTFSLIPNEFNLSQKIEIPQMLFQVGGMRKLKSEKQHETQDACNHHLYAEDLPQ